MGNYPEACCFKDEIYATVLGNVRLTVISEPAGLMAFSGDLLRQFSEKAQFELCFLRHHLLIPWRIERKLYMTVEHTGQRFDLFLYVADNIAGYIQGLLDGVAFSHTTYALDRDSRKTSLSHFLGKTRPENAAEREAT